MEKELLLEAWRSFRSRPLVWLLVSAACVPYSFAVSTGAPDVVFVAGFVLTYMLLFLSWCMAAYAYAGEPEAGTREMLAEAREVLAYSPRKFLNLSSIYALGVFALNMMVNMVLGMVVMSVDISGGIPVFIVFYYLNYVLLAMALSLFGLVPQLATLRHDFEEETANPSAVLRVSYELTRDRYKRALPLFLFPLLVESSALLLFMFLLPLAAELGMMYSLICILSIVVLSLIEGAKTSYIAAAYNHFLDVVEAEEKEIKKKKPAKGKETQASQQKKPVPGKAQAGASGKKQLPSSGKKGAAGSKAQGQGKASSQGKAPDGSKAPPRKPGPSPHKKKK